MSAPIIRRNEIDLVDGMLDEQASLWNRGDLSTYLSFYAPDAVYVSAGGELLHGPESIGRILRDKYDFSAGPPGQLTYSGLFAHMVSPGIAVVSGQYRVESAEPVTPTATGFFSLVLRRRCSAWEIVLDHPS